MISASRNQFFLLLPLFLSSQLAEAQTVDGVARRMKMLEHFWDGSTNKKTKEESSRAVDAVTFQMLTGQIGKASQTIDAAILELQKDFQGEVIPEWFANLDIKVSKMHINPGLESIQGIVYHAYARHVSPSQPSRIRIRWEVNGKEMDPVDVRLPMDSFRFELFPPNMVATARVWCEPEGAKKDSPLAVYPQANILINPQKDIFTQLLLKKRASVLELPASVGKNTWLARCDELLSFEAQGKRTPSTGFINELIKLPDIPLNDIKNGIWPEPTPGSDQLLVFPLGKGNMPVRIRLPKKISSDCECILAIVALHGAGDDENKWIDGFGHFLSAHCEKRGWAMICPRGGYEPDLLPLVKKWMALKTVKIAIIGHSQGGSQALAFGANHPDKVLGLAALGASGRIGNGEEYHKLPVFIGVGTDDLAIRPCELMVQAMRDHEKRNLYFLTYKNIGHVMVPLASKNGLLDFLDGALGNKHENGVPGARHGD